MEKYIQVGSSCLSDFLGKDGTMYANMAELYHTADELAEASAGESWGGGGALYDYLDAFLSHVAEVVAIHGWVSRKMANESGNPSTSDIAQRHMHPRPYDKKEDRLYDAPSEKSIEVAKQAIEWCDSLSDDEVEASEYLHNIRLIARRGVVGARQYGYAASIISAYNRTLMDKIIKERQEKTKAVSQYVGEIGKRQNFTVMVEKVLALETAYGTSHMHIMTDDHGNRLTWFSTGKVLDTGVLMVIKATPKKFEEYKGCKQTILTRCAVVE